MLGEGGQMVDSISIVRIEIKRLVKKPLSFILFTFRQAHDAEQEVSPRIATVFVEGGIDETCRLVQLSAVGVKFSPFERIGPFIRLVGRGVGYGWQLRAWQQVSPVFGEVRRGIFGPLSAFRAGTG